MKKFLIIFASEFYAGNQTKRFNYFENIVGTLDMLQYPGNDSLFSKAEREVRASAPGQNISPIET